MKTLEIKKTASGQYVYSVVEFSQVVVPQQYGTFDKAETVQQAQGRFRFDAVRDITECKVLVRNRNGGLDTVHMTKDCYDRSANRFNSYSQDVFLGEITEMAGVAVCDDDDVPF
jgi:hypothetical protein